ncbi:hypothetical protein DFH09DRAFT_229213 [Mycena vulgaris]|nr:hypothetical protein DFH09DRAFT_229213 [Mycena vulgaris]
MLVPSTAESWIFFIVTLYSSAIEAVGSTHTIRSYRFSCHIFDHLRSAYSSFSPVAGGNRSQTRQILLAARAPWTRRGQAVGRPRCAAALHGQGYGGDLRRGLSAGLGHGTRDDPLLVGSGGSSSKWRILPRGPHSGKAEDGCANSARRSGDSLCSPNGPHSLTSHPSPSRAPVFPARDERRLRFPPPFGPSHRSPMPTCGAPPHVRAASV